MIEEVKIFNRDNLEVRIYQKIVELDEGVENNSTYLPSENDPAVMFRPVGKEGNYLYEHTLRKSELTPR